MHATKLKQLTLAAAVITLCSACSTDGSLGLTSKVDYRSGSDNINSNTLEVPPDLTAVSGTSSYNSPNTAKAAEAIQSLRKQSGNTVLPQYTNARIVTQDGIRFIEADVTPDQAWDNVKDFWLSNGFILTTENPTIGIMETDWLQNRADLPTDAITKLFRKIADQFVSTDTLDRYRARIERSSKPNAVNIYITHRGMTEVYKEGQATTQQWNGTVWTPSAPKPELEAEIMGLMLQSFGVSKQASQDAIKPAETLPARANLLASQQIEILDGYDRAWRRVGLAFDRIGYNIQDRNRSTGVYTVQRAASDIDKESETSYFSSLAFWKKSDATDAASKSLGQTFEVKLTEQGGKTLLTLSSKEGAINPDVQKKILNDLLLQLK
ncbi:outer membrane protein assembly factor BamC [Chitinibacter sp. GC72]|uniref:outer membrane protein assembly factor BamC n=1 Tax=Chitinibacter sp. GC72 TaxID=1526917 RepID=UPI0012FC73C8|nr:outer membrane protein assembly factor BamC [Chitinibacter sp. GC72]